MKIAFLLDNAYGIGGTIRSTVNLSRALADRHTVEVVSLRRTVDRPALPFDSRVVMTHLIDLRRSSLSYDGDDPLFRKPSQRFSEGPDHCERGIATRLGDLRVAEYLRMTDADVVIATRPKINDYLAAFGEDRYLRIGQEHLTRAMHGPHVRDHQDAAIARLDAFVTVSYADASDYRSALPATAVPTPGGATTITCIPNAVPAADVEASDGDSRLIVAAGRLIKVKRYDRLVAAFALVAERHPDWRLRLYGRGRRHAALRAQIDSLGLYDRAFLMGPHSPIETEWAKGAIAAVSSDGESFGMTLVEAMHCGVPVVSTDCPYGPGEIIEHGRDGLLAPLAGDERTTVRSYADALLQLVENPDLRHRMGRAALEKAARYAPERIATEYEQLIEQLLAVRPSPGTRAAGGTPEQGEQPGGAPQPAARGGDAAPAPRASGTAARATTARTVTPRPAPTGRPVRRALRRAAVRSVGPVLRPLRRRWRRYRGRAAATAQLRRPLARVRMAADGAMVVRLRARRLPAGASALLLSLPRARRTAPVRVSLPPRTQAVDGWIEVRVERAAHRLAEGRWDVYVERAVDGRRKRVRPQLVETARLLSAPPPLDADGVLAHWVPYTTADGYLAVRSWRRDGHAEVVAVDLGPGSCTVRAELYGRAARAEALDQGAVVAVSRSEDAPGFELPLPAGLPLGTLAGAQAGAHAGAQALAFELPYELPAALGGEAADGVWDLWLRPGPRGTAPVRFGRLLGDLADRKKTDVLPRRRLGDSEVGVQLYYSLNNNLVVQVQPMPHDQQAAAASSAAPAASATASPPASASAPGAAADAPAAPNTPAGG